MEFRSPGHGNDVGMPKAMAETQLREEEIRYRRKRERTREVKETKEYSICLEGVNPHALGTALHMPAFYFRCCNSGTTGPVGLASVVVMVWADMLENRKSFILNRCGANN